MPFCIADAGLVLASTSLRVATVGQAVGDVTGFSLPVVFTITIYGTSGVFHTTLTSARAVVGTRIHPGREKRGRSSQKGIETMISLS